jgi:hypothetical protein
MITGLSIKRYESRGIRFTESVSKYNPAVIVNKLINQTPEDMLNYFVKKYLITTEITKAGSQTQNCNHRIVGSTPSEQIAIEYLKERERKIDMAREGNLEDILDYGKVVFGRRFDIKKLKEISSKVASSIPTEIAPTHTVFATLRPSDRFGFGKGPKLRG